MKQKIKELKAKVALGVILSRLLLSCLIVSLTINSVLAFQLYQKKAIVENDSKKQLVIVGTDNLEQVSDNILQIIPDKDLPLGDLPPLPQHLQ